MKKISLIILFCICVSSYAIVLGQDTKRVVLRDIKVDRNAIRKDLHVFNERSALRTIFDKLLAGDEVNDLKDTEKPVFLFWYRSLPYIITLIEKPEKETNDYEEIRTEAEKISIDDENNWLGYYLLAYAYIEEGMPQSNKSENYDFQRASDFMDRATSLGYRYSDKFPLPKDIIPIDEMVTKLLSDADAFMAESAWIEADNALYRCQNLGIEGLSRADFFFKNGVVSYNLSDSLAAVTYFELAREAGYPDLDAITNYDRRIAQGFVSDIAAGGVVTVNEKQLTSLIGLPTNMTLTIPGYPTLQIKKTTIDSYTQLEELTFTGQEANIRGGKIYRFDFDILKFNKSIFYKLIVFTTAALTLISIE